MIGELELSEPPEAQSTLRRAVPVATAVQFASTIAERAAAEPGAQETALLDLRLVLEELLTNVVRHAFRGHPQPMGHCWVETDVAHSVDIRIEDNGPPFNPFDPSNEAGCGLALVRGLVGSYSWEFTGRQNRLNVRMSLA